MFLGADAIYLSLRGTNGDSCVTATSRCLKEHAIASDTVREYTIFKW